MYFKSEYETLLLGAKRKISWLYSKPVIYKCTVNKLMTRTRMTNTIFARFRLTAIFSLISTSYVLCQWLIKRVCCHKNILGKQLKQ